MKQRKSETRICPLMAGPPHITCLGTKCMLYKEESDSGVAYCILRSIDSLAESLDKLRQIVDKLM